MALHATEVHGFYEFFLKEVIGASVMEYVLQVYSYGLLAPKHIQMGSVS
jgi:hypothetical protein